MAKEPLLNLSTFFHREHVLIDGKPYEYRNKDELSVIDFEALTAHGQRISDLAAKENELTDADVDELEQLSSLAIKRILVSIPDDVIGRLTLTQRTSVITVFTSLLGTPMPPGETGVEKNGRLIGV